MNAKPTAGGHGELDHQVYQPKEEIAMWMERCPIKKIEQQLLVEGHIQGGYCRTGGIYRHVCG
ncbi:MAG: hypothetical protein RQM92_13395 [Candidatus Syntrophopropionicum ammoniitolerans]